MTKILAVDDESDLLDLVEYNLKRGGFEVLRALDGHTALELAYSASPDLILLDVMLPDIGGFEILERLRTDDATSSIPVIMLTARHEEEDVLEGFEAGADDYVSKPFSPRELLARIRAVLVRSSRATDNGSVLEYGELKIDPDEHRVFVGDEELILAPQEYKLLVHLCANPRRVHSREELLTQAWDDEVFVEPRTVDVHIRRLRSHLEVLKSSRKWIETVRGAGYRFNPNAGQGK